jgi:2-keto-4-pentenoate hydratase/2-oxohepta-3-ene-1,7-dioic acid hydratase in catechol pathway
MRIGRFTRAADSPFWGLIDPTAGTVRRMGGALREWASDAAAERMASLPLEPAELALEDLRWLPPLEPGARVLGCGANYKIHLTRLGAEPPDQPVAFIKPDSAVIGHEAEISYPRTTEKLDYEVELVAMLAGPLSEGGDAGQALLGFTVGNDVSARDAMSPFGGPDMYGMKSLDATSPLGPWISTPAELAGGIRPQVGIALRVNGEERQRDHTSQMIFPVDVLLRYLDARTRLRCGDVMFTGTTAGVGLEDGRFLKPGDVVEAEIDGIGVLRNTVGPRPAR